MVCGVGAQTVGRKTSWAKDVWANYFLGDRRLGDKLGRYGDSKSDGWATFFRWMGEMCERGNNSKLVMQSYDRCVPCD